MGVVANRFYNDPGMAQAAANLSELFAAPSGSDMSGFATARAKAQETAQRAQLWAQAAGDPDRQAVIADLYDPSQSYYAVDTDAATKEAVARTQLEGTKYTADRSYAGNVVNSLLAPIAKDAVRAVPPSIASQYDVPTTEYGNIGAAQGETIFKPDGGVVQGTPKPLGETEVKGGILADLVKKAQEQDPSGKSAMELMKQAILGTDVVNTVGPTGPVVANRFDASGQTPLVEPKAAAGLDTYVDSAGKTFVGHSDEKGQVYDQNDKLVPNAQRKGAPTGGAGDAIEAVDDYVALGPDNKEISFIGYFDKNDKKVHDQTTGQPVPNVIRKGLGNAFSVKTNADGTVEITQGTGAGKSPTEAMARANYVGIQAKPAAIDLIKAYDTGALPDEGDYWLQYSLDNADRMEPSLTKAALDFANERFGRTKMSPQGQAFYANMQTILPLELLIQSGAAVNEGEAQRKRNQLMPRPSDTPQVKAIRRRGLTTFLTGLDQWAKGEINKTDFPDIESEIAAAGGDTAAPAAPAAAAPAAAAPAAAPAAPAAPAAAPGPNDTVLEFDAQGNLIK